MRTFKFSVHARWFGSQVYVRKTDLLKWFDEEAEALHEAGSHEREEQVRSLADSLRKVRAS